MDPKNILSLSESVRRLSPELNKHPVVAGFDGFVDEIISVVDERKNLDQWTSVRDIATFGQHIVAAAGRSSLREIIVHRADPGGCAVNLGDGLMTLGIPLDCFATLGQPRHPAFDAFALMCRQCVSWGREPGRTLAFEFADGKLMFSAVRQLADFTPALLDQVLADGNYLQACQRASLIALTDWTLYPHMTDCWEKLMTDVYAKLTHRPWFYLDLVDPTSRSEADIRRMLKSVPDFEKSGRLVLGLNGTEANVLSAVLGLNKSVEDLEQIQAQAAALREKLQVSEVVIHCVRMAASATSQGTYGAPGPYCPAPKKSTGAGDRFNAGYCAGLLLEQSPENRLVMGNAASGFFVRNARSANAAEWADFMGQWAQGKID